MIVNSLLLLILFVFIAKIAKSKADKKHMLLVFLVTATWLFGWLFVLQTELNFDGTYGSDARYYFMSMKEAVSSSNSLETAMEFLAPGYVLFGTLILLTSPDDSVVWVKIGNILLFLLCLSIIFKINIDRGAPKKLSIYSLLLIGLNGTITWMVLRNLKETMFLFLILLQILFLNSTINRFFKKFRYTYFWIAFFFGTIICSYFLQLLRPYGSLFAIILSIATLFKLAFEVKKNNMRKKFKFAIRASYMILIVGSISAIVLYGDWWWNYFLAYTDLYGMGSPLNNLIAFPLKLGNFMLGPGPVRTAFQLFEEDIFVASAFTGDILIFFGSILWWIVLGYIIVLLIRSLSYDMLGKTFDILIPIVLIAFLYSITYGGSSDTRQKAMVYVLLQSIIPILYNSLSHKGKEQLPILGTIMSLLVWIIGTIMSVVSLQLL